MNIQEPLQVYTPRRTSPHLNPNVQRWLHDLTKYPDGTLKATAEYLVRHIKTSNLDQGNVQDALMTVILLLSEMERPTPAELPSAVA